MTNRTRVTSYCTDRYLDFIIWVLCVSGLHVPPFCYHKQFDRYGLQKLGLTAESWMEWFKAQIDQPKTYRRSTLPEESIGQWIRWSGGETQTFPKNLLTEDESSIPAPQLILPFSEPLSRAIYTINFTHLSYRRKEMYLLTTTIVDSDQHRTVLVRYPKPVTYIASELLTIHGLPKGYREERLWITRSKYQDS